VVMESERAARLLSEERLFDIRNSKLAAPQRATLENLFANIAEGQKPTLQMVLKGDVQGSVEALVGALKEIPQSKITLDIIHSAVGPITESDVLLASASNAVIIGFSVKVENNAATVAKREGVQVKLYSIIYELIDGAQQVELGLRPSSNFRAQESPVSEPLGWPYEFRAVGDCCELALKNSALPPLRMLVVGDDATFTLKGYTVHVTPDSDGVQHVSCPDLPQLSVQEGSLNGALAHAEDAIAAILAGRDKP